MIMVPFDGVYRHKIEEYFFGDMKNYGRGVGVCKKCGKRKVVK